LGQPRREVDRRRREEAGETLEASQVHLLAGGVLEAEADRGLGGLPLVLLHVEAEEVADGAGRDGERLLPRLGLGREALRRERREPERDPGVAARGPDDDLAPR